MEKLGTYSESESHLGRTLLDFEHGQRAKHQLVLCVTIVVFWGQIRRWLLSQTLLFFQQLIKLIVWNQLLGA